MTGICYTTTMKRLMDRLKEGRRTVVFTGAGVSTLCGIPDFRGPQGLYREADADKIFDIDWFRLDPSFYYKGCRKLIYGLRGIQPGPAHTAIARLEQRGLVNGVITQNIDMLHQKAGSRTVFEIHGSPIRHYCVGCGLRKSFEEICDMLEKATIPYCEKCGAPFKPEITFFGESLPERAFEGAVALARQAKLILVLGSSLTVHPAASIPSLTLNAGGRLVIINAQPTPLDQYATLTYPDLREFSQAVLEEFEEEG